MPIKCAFVAAWSGLFNLCDASSRGSLNDYLPDVLTTLHNLCRNPIMLASNKQQIVIEALGEICLKSDSSTPTATKHVNNLLNDVLNLVANSIQTPNEVFPNLNKEQFDIVFNHYCSLVQPIIYKVGEAQDGTVLSWDDSFIKNVIQLVLNIFQQQQAVSSGPLFILHGLISVVAKRFTETDINSIVEILLAALRDPTNC